MPEATATIKLIPQPSMLQVHTGSYLLGDSLPISINDDALSGLVEYAVAELFVGKASKVGARTFFALFEDGKGR